ncbi:radical SAM protein [Maledivibacter halophilus]|uniref:Radical SAM additional 4Fe4S-binding SPASM domain-containing protein n=1 Tax=Maledivibacter halophilus TaxID=36842 RepID=A0A1T5J818_9FIRM|nr:radical SAM protein [Maledivibacter halophilus]SKC47575.1 radical SAM additional 4Fe4S-binding SPASM domain-containing protein [Maledivibacter halophilus]
MNKRMILRMAVDKNVFSFLLQAHKIFSKDSNYSIFKGIKAIRYILKGEKIVKFQDKYILSTFMPPFPSRAFMTHITAVREEKNIFTQQIYSKRSAPISMHVSLTDRCLYNCFHCSAKGREVKKELTTEEWKKVFKELQEMKTSVIGLTGGEPLLRDDIEKLIEGIDDRSSVVLFTSGQNFTREKAISFKNKGLFGVGISLDSCIKEEHNKIRRNEDAFDNAVTAIKIAAKEGLYTIVQTVVLKNDINEEKLFKLFSFAKELGAHEVKILEPIISGNLLLKEDINEILYDTESRKKLIEIQHRANKTGRYPKITTFAYTESKEKYGCGAGTQHSYISTAGDLYPCDFVPMNFGNVKNESVSKLWSEMNETIGNPKIGCFAMRVNKTIQNNSKGILPLCTEKSKELCAKNKSKEFPDFYRELQ